MFRPSSLSRLRRARIAPELRAHNFGPKGSGKTESAG